MKNAGCGTGYSGWYSKLFYSDFNHQFVIGLMEKDHIVADIHTVPTDCGGGVIGAIPHVGTGEINLRSIFSRTSKIKNMAFIGPVLSYYEYTHLIFYVFTDQEWDNT